MMEWVRVIGLLCVVIWLIALNARVAVLEYKHKAIQDMIRDMVKEETEKEMESFDDLGVFGMRRIRVPSNEE